jgi:trehalose-6-phosphatase
MYFLKAKSSLSEVEKTAVEKIFSDYKAALKEINPDSKPVNLKSETFTKILELNTNLYASLKPYVDSSKAT